MISETHSIPLEGLCQAIVDCEHKTAPTSSRGFPSIRTTDIKNGRLDLIGANKVSAETYREWTARMEPKPGDLILAREAPVGEVGIIPSRAKICLGQRTVLIRTDESKVLPRFLLYLLLTPAMRYELIRRAEGSTVPHLNVADVRRLPIPLLPPIPQQQVVVSILGSIDDKVVLNRRMNQSLEETARALFKFWFVDFGPVQAKSEGRWKKGESQPGMPADMWDLWPNEFEDSEIGEIPQGWEVKPVSSAVAVNPERRLKRDEQAPYVEMSQLPTSSPRVEGWVNRRYASGSRFENGDVLVARITPCLENGKTAYVDFLADGGIGWGSTEFLVLRSKAPLPTQWTYLFARTEAFRNYLIQNMSGTSGRQRAPAGCLNSFPIAVPSRGVAERFGMVIAPLFGAMKRNDAEAATLSSARDALLPKLLSGEIHISA
jgi:type I restriction enzyme, S subunit